MNNENDTVIEKILEQTKTILSLGAGTFDEAIAKKEKTGITDLSKSIAQKTGTQQKFVYGVLSAYIEMHPKLVISRGPGGGVESKESYDKTQAEQEKKKMEKTYKRYSASVRELKITKQEFETAKIILRTESPTLQALKEWKAGGSSNVK
jgi:hypothetical protein